MADPLPASLLALIEDYEVSVETIRQRVTAYARATWENQYDHADEAIAGWIAALAPIVNGAQQLTGTLTANYLAAFAALVEANTALTADTIPPDAMTTQALRGVDDATLYRRPQIDFWDSIRNGDPSAIAVAIGALHLEEIVWTNLQLARTHAAQRVLTGHLGTVVIGYRRLINGSACSLCRHRHDLFSKHELMPIHARCRCGIVPVYSDGPDPGEISLGPPGGDRGTPRVVQHGEVGPMLVAEGDHFTPAR
jgi:hypothetical protein